MKKWLKHARQSFMDELVRRDGLGNFDVPGLCHACEKVAGTIRCKECSGSMLLCEECAIDSHRRNPLHRIEVRVSGLPENIVVFIHYRNGTTDSSKGLRLQTLGWRFI